MTFLSALLPLLAASPAQPAPPSATNAAAPIRLWMNNDGRFREGDYVRVQVDAEANGFLLVLQYDPYGRLRVLFPLDPRDDNRVQAGRRYEVRDDGGRFAFRADGDGPGLIYSAIAPEPFRFDDIVTSDGRWDYDRLAINQGADDPEPEITQLVQGLSGPGGFDYDLRDYRVYGSSGNTVVYRNYVYNDVYNDYGYDPFCDWRWSYSGCRSFRFGLSFGYDPFYYYGYPSRRYYGYYPYSYPYYPRVPVVVRPRAPSAVVSGRPRNYTVTPIRPRGSVVSPRPIDWRTRNDFRPNVSPRTTVRPRPQGWTPPAARPSRPGSERREFRGGGDNRDRGRVFSPANRDRGRVSSPDRDRGRSFSPPPRSEPRSRPSVERNSGGDRRGGQVVRGNNGGGQSRPPAPSRPRRP